MDQVDEITYWMFNSPTIAEVRRLHRETPYEFPLPLLNALMDAGVDIEKESHAVLKQGWINAKDAFGEVLKVTLDGKLIAVLNVGDVDGKTVYYVKGRRIPAKHASSTKATGKG